MPLFEVHVGIDFLCWHLLFLAELLAVRSPLVGITTDGFLDQPYPCVLPLDDQVEVVGLAVPLEKTLKLWISWIGVTGVLVGQADLVLAS